MPIEGRRGSREVLPEPAPFGESLLLSCLRAFDRSYDDTFWPRGHSPLSLSRPFTSSTSPAFRSLVTMGRFGVRCGYNFQRLRLTARTARGRTPRRGPQRQHPDRSRGVPMRFWLRAQDPYRLPVIASPARPDPRRSAALLAQAFATRCRRASHSTAHMRLAPRNTKPSFERTGTGGGIGWILKALLLKAPVT
jgi:hypothetical protein